MPGITPAEHAERRARLLEHADGAGIVLFDADYIRYFTGFNFLATERPVAVVIDAGGALAAFVPEFEVERVRAETDFDRIDSYPEYPGEVHPLELLARTLADMGIEGAIGADQDGYPGILGYRGPPLGAATGARVTLLADRIESMLARKSAAALRPRGRRTGGGVRGAPPRSHVRGRGQGGAPLLRGERPAAVLASTRRPCDRAPEPRGAVPRRRRPHRGRARHGVHDRAGPL